jgi:hypothetical protein
MNLQRVCLAHPQLRSPGKRKARTRDDETHNSPKIPGCGLWPYPGYSLLATRLNDRPRFETFMMARTSSPFTEKPDTRMQPFRFADDQIRSAADERYLRGESIRELLGTNC